MKRSLESAIKQDLEEKFILLSGPRQVGKTTLSKDLTTSFDYLNYDALEDRRRIQRGLWDRTKRLLIFDEIHKMKDWKRWLKGIFDTERKGQVIVTGSARMDTHKKVGDSMAGRYFQYHLMPLDLKELNAHGHPKTQENLEKLLTLSGFPEPFLRGSKEFYRKWRKTHLDIIIKQDLIELESIKRIADVGMLVELMTERIGSPLSYNSLREDLSTDDKTVKRWLLLLENTYVFFKVLPYSKSVKYALKKSPKYYFYDVPRALDEGARLENFVALSLLKEIHYQNDAHGYDFSLHYVRNTHEQEVDFLICANKKPHTLIEVKTSDDRPSKGLSHFASQLRKSNPRLRQVQLVKTLKRNFSTPDGIEVVNLAEWLEELELRE